MLDSFTYEDNSENSTSNNIGIYLNSEGIINKIARNISWRH